MFPAGLVSYSLNAENIVDIPEMKAFFTDEKVKAAADRAAATMATVANALARVVNSGKAVEALDNLEQYNLGKPAEEQIVPSSYSWNPTSSEVVLHFQ